jgi:hypothetical protein
VNRDLVNTVLSTVGTARSAALIVVRPGANTVNGAATQVACLNINIAIFEFTGITAPFSNDIMREHTALGTFFTGDGAGSEITEFTLAVDGATVFISGVTFLVLFSTISVFAFLTVILGRDRDSESSELDTFITGGGASSP